MNERCTFGDEPGEDRHHPTGRDDEGRYLDPSFMASLCHDDHELCHDDLKTGAIENTRPIPTFLERLQLGLERLSRFLGRLADTRSEDPLGGFLAALAAATSSWAAKLAATIVALDQGTPRWRTLPGIA